MGGLSRTQGEGGGTGERGGWDGNIDGQRWEMGKATKSERRACRKQLKRLCGELRGAQKNGEPGGELKIKK